MDRWQRLFADLETQADADERVDLDAEVAERTRTERGRIRLVDRLRAASGPITVRLPGLSVAGVVQDVGPDWVLIEERFGTKPRDVVVALSAVETIWGLAPEAVEPGSEGQVAARRDLRHVLRAVARDRAVVMLSLVTGPRIGVRIDRVGADHLDVTPIEGDERGGALAVPLGAIAVVRRD